jgi:signal transduction histidine kinase
LLHEPTDQWHGAYLPDVLLEFVGAEEALQAVLRGELPRLRLERINRLSAENNTTAYVDFEATALQTEAGAELLVVVEDTSVFGRLEQALVQERNELRLLQQRLAQANVELQHLDRLKSLFFAMAAHDLRTPLSVIRGYAKLLARDLSQVQPPVAQALLDYGETMQTQADWLDLVIANVLNLDQIEQGQLTMRTVPIDLNIIARDAAALMQPLTRLNEQTLTVACHENGVLAAVDPDRLYQVLLNLIGNAAKYTPPGGQITVTTAIDGSDAVLAVEDTGPGLSAEQLTHVFDLYYRTTDAQLSSVRGTGLGLFIVKTFVAAHDGTVGVDSQLGVGTTFTIRIPLHTSQTQR